MAARIAFLLFGIFLFGPGSGYYIGAGLGPGPRDGLMTGLAKRGHPVRTVRTAIELAALAIGAALGGTVGVGTVVFALAAGPNVHFFLTIIPPPGPPSRRPTQTHQSPGPPQPPSPRPPRSRHALVHNGAGITRRT